MLEDFEDNVGVGALGWGRKEFGKDTPGKVEGESRGYGMTVDVGSNSVKDRSSGGVGWVGWGYAEVSLESKGGYWSAGGDLVGLVERDQGDGVGKVGKWAREGKVEGSVRRRSEIPWVKWCIVDMVASYMLE